MVTNQQHEAIFQVYQAALLSVNGRTNVRYFLANISFEKTRRIVSIGKAADAMALGVADVLGKRALSVLGYK